MTTKASNVEQKLPVANSDQSPSSGETSVGLARVVVAGVNDAAAKPADQRFLFFAAIPSWLVSMFVHVLVLLLLAWMTLPPQILERANELSLGNAETVELSEAPIFEPLPDQLDEITTQEIVTADSLPPSEIVPDMAMNSLEIDLQRSSTAVELNPMGDFAAPSSQLLDQIGAVSGAGFDGRNVQGRARLVREGGGNSESERAVAEALKWFQRHQSRDGSWSFLPLEGLCDCSHLGSLDVARNGATAMALLPFLGAGNTHQEGQFQKEVRAGLYYLLSQQQANGSFADAGNLYSHGLCAITLCEAYAMTQDGVLARPAQAALDYIAYAQDPVGGGWRYTARQPGDTSVVGWQLMALKSGRMAYLHVNPAVFVGATKFLDSVQTENGAAYGYKDPGDRIATTAIGLLCRMYLGWGRDRPALKAGINRISKRGPSKLDMYYNYYATQVMRHYEGDTWEKWNSKMRDFLVKTQESTGHERGSWFMGQNHASKAGGRLYCTSMATMVLEVYYRHMPLYRKQVTEDDFEF